MVDAHLRFWHFDHWVNHELSKVKRNYSLIAESFLHGFVTRTSDCTLAYKCAVTYAPTTVRSVHFDDPDLAIDWRIDAQDAALSDKDAAAPGFAGAFSPFTYLDAK